MKAICACSNHGVQHANLRFRLLSCLLVNISVFVLLFTSDRSLFNLTTTFFFFPSTALFIKSLLSLFFLVRLED